MIPLKKYCELFDDDFERLYITIYNYEKEGNIPIFAKRIGSSYYVEPTMLDYYTDKNMTAWKLATDTIYWLLTDWMCMNGTNIGRELATRSSVFKNYQSWASFISSDLFAIPEQRIYSPRPTMIQEFALHGTHMVIDHYNKTICHQPKGIDYDDFDWDTHINKTIWINQYRDIA